MITCDKNGNCNVPIFEDEPEKSGLPIKGYWQTVRCANKRLLADRSQNM